MDFALSPEQEALRHEVRSFLAEVLPPKYPEVHIVPEEGTEEEWEFSLAVSKKLAERGWYTAAWPKEYGGQDFDPLQMLVLSEELGYHGVIPVNIIGMITADLILEFGTEEQKRQHLPGIASCEVIWGEGYSEPGSGSDLASLETAARLDADSYVVNGTKIWTGQAHRAHWMFVFARTDPEASKHRGLSYLLLDMQTPGITVLPLLCMADVVTFNQEFFEDVRIPTANLLGEANSGWQMRSTPRSGHTPSGRRRPGSSTLNGPNSPGSFRRHVERLAQHLQGSTPARPAVRLNLADRAIEAEVARVLEYRLASVQAADGAGIVEGETSGLFNRDMSQHLANAGVRALGLYGALRTGSRRAQLNGWFAMSYMFTVPATIYGGTSEIHRNLLAQRGLGLPRG